MNIRTRFAPSPTGSLHIGSLRTALFGYLIAKSRGGDFILRIEDTDQKREVPGATESLIKILAWAGIEFDEGPGFVRGTTNAAHTNKEKDVGSCGPYIQTERLDIYKKYAQELLDKGGAYRCFCTEERLKQIREEQAARKLPPRYDRCCRNLAPEEIKKRLAAGEKFVIRQKLPLTGEIVVKDELRGEIKFKAQDLDDHILIKSDGVPTYHFASVVDDHLMKINPVVRSTEWLPSFPKNFLLYGLFGWQAPRFIHIPLVLDKDGGKLSKRKGNVSVEDFRAQGYLPEALINFNALLGWHPEGDNEIFSLEEAIKNFKTERISISPAVFDIDKLDYFNGVYIRRKDLKELLELCRPFLAPNLALTSSEYKKSDEFLIKVISLARDRLKNLAEIVELTKYFFYDSLEYETQMLVWRKSTPAGTKKALEDLKEFLTDIPEENWQIKDLEEKVTAWLKENDRAVGDHLWPMRVALTGEKASPSPFEMADALGKTETLEKINLAINKIK